MFVYLGCAGRWYLRNPEESEKIGNLAQKNNSIGHRKNNQLKMEGNFLATYVVNNTKVYMSLCGFLSIWLMLEYVQVLLTYVCK